MKNNNRQTVKELDQYLQDNFDFKVNDLGAQDLFSHARHFKKEIIIEAIEISFNQYYNELEAFNKIGGIAYNLTHDNPR